MSTIYERSTSNPSTQLTTFLEFEFNKTSLVYSGLILVSFRSAWACIRSVHSTYIDVYCLRTVKKHEIVCNRGKFSIFCSQSRFFSKFSTFILVRFRCSFFLRILYFEIDENEGVLKRILVLLNFESRFSLKK